MFGHQLYPTPRHIAYKMIAPYLRSPVWHSVLDPSAGTGNLLECAQSHKQDAAFYAIEIDQNLRTILAEKDFTLIGSDFLEYSDPVMRFSLILMNPPFDRGVDHVLHAWDLVADGGELCALVNAETIANPNSKKRQLLARIIDEYGITESLGRCFANSENPTDVSVTMIRLTKPVAPNTFDFGDGFAAASAVEQREFTENPLACSSMIDSLVDQYNAAIASLIEKDLIERKLDFYLSTESYKISQFDDKYHLRKPDKSLNSRAIKIRQHFWDIVFKRTELKKRTTSKFHKDFDSYQRTQGTMEFSKANVIEVLRLFFENASEIMQNCIVDVFDKITAYHEKNAVYVEGWKTNSGWKINKKIIHPTYATYGWHYINDEAIKDLEAVLCYIGGYKDIKSVSEAAHPFVNGWSGVQRGEFETTFFDGKIFKKGTLHLTFKDLDLLAEFNRRAAIGKKWIGGDGF